MQFIRPAYPTPFPVRLKPRNSCRSRSFLRTVPNQIYAESTWTERTENIISNGITGSCIEDLEIQTSAVQCSATYPKRVRVLGVQINSFTFFSKFKILLRNQVQDYPIACPIVTPNLSVNSFLSESDFRRAILPSDSPSNFLDVPECTIVVFQIKIFVL